MAISIEKFPGLLYITVIRYQAIEYGCMSNQVLFVDSVRLCITYNSYLLLDDDPKWLPCWISTARATCKLRTKWLLCDVQVHFDCADQYIIIVPWVYHESTLMDSIRIPSIPITTIIYRKNPIHIPWILHKKHWFRDWWESDSYGTFNGISHWFIFPINRFMMIHIYIYTYISHLCSISHRYPSH